MAGKRHATSELNRENWDREEEPAERGTFRTATEDELKNRVIKKAKRQITAGNDVADNGASPKSVFSGFSGFGKPAASESTTSSSPFSFLNKIQAVPTATSVTPKRFFVKLAPDVPKTTESSNSSLPFKNSVDSAVPSDSKLSKTASANLDISEYQKKLGNLNQAVCDWIKTHVDKNPVCILSPIFKDYEKYLEEIENDRKSRQVKEETSVTANNEGNSSTAADMGNFKFSAIPINNSETLAKSPETKSNNFNAPIKKTDDSLLPKPSTTSSFTFNLNAPIATSSTTSNFSFGNPSNNSNQLTTKPKTFSFTVGDATLGYVKPPDPVPNTSESEQNAEDEEPPKNEFKQVVEEDAIYFKKCKVFVKKDGNFVDKGVGTLYLKPVESSGKTQLLVRADTNLGNILVNLILSSAIPTQRMGKNNVMMICLPTPDVEKPASVLLRVKTGEEADELLENIDKNKK